MAVVQIPNLPPIIALDGTEEMEAVQAGVSGRLTTAQIAGLASLNVVHNLYQMDDVNVSEDAGINGQYLKWDNATSFWVAGKPTEIPTTSVSASGALTIDRSISEIQIVTLTNNVFGFTINGWPAAGIMARTILQVENTGAYAINAWPVGTKWVNGIPPVVTIGIGSSDIFILTTFDGGATIFGTIVGQNYL